MRLIAVLIWYDEPAWCLTELVASLAAADVDHLVAVDGAYALFPGARAQSRSDQAQAVLAAAQGARMGVTLHVPRDLWMGNEVQKRSFAFAAGHLAGTPGEDWLWICDADEVVAEATGLRAALERTPHDAGEIVLDQIMDTGHEGQLFIRKLFRVQASGIRCDGNHYTYMTGDGRLLGLLCRPSPALEDAEPLHFVRVEHRQMNRPADRVDARDRYYRIRRDTNAELEVA